MDMTQDGLIDHVLEKTGFSSKSSPKLRRLLEFMYAQQPPNFTPRPTKTQEEPIAPTMENIGASIAGKQSKLAQEYPFGKK
jgi:hypothetical protein